MQLYSTSNHNFNMTSICSYAAHEGTLALTNKNIRLIELLVMTTIWTAASESTHATCHIQHQQIMIVAAFLSTRAAVMHQNNQSLQ